MNLKGERKPADSTRVAGDADTEAGRTWRFRQQADALLEELLSSSTPARNDQRQGDRTALILGLAGTLEEKLTRKNDAAAKKHRDDELKRDSKKGREGETLGEACITFAEHFADNVWAGTFNSKEPTSQEQRRAAAIYRFALIEAYRERGISESADSAVDGGNPEIDST